MGKILLLLFTAAIIGGGTWLWLTRNTPKPWLNVWIYTPSTATVSADVTSQLEKKLPGGGEAKLTLSNLSIVHRRGEAKGTWSASAKVWLTVPRYEPVDWTAAVQKAGFDAAEYSKVLATWSELGSNNAPRKPDEKAPLLAREVVASGQTVEIALRGSVLLQGKDWPVSVDDLTGAQAQIAPLLKGHPLREIGESALREDSDEAKQALAAYINEHQAFMKEVNATRQRESESRERKQAEQRSEDEQAAAGLAQAGWHALEKLSGYLVNVGINQRLIDIASQRGDTEKVALYRSYEEANRQNIQDAASSYAQSMTSLSRLPLAIRQKAVKDVQREIVIIGASGSPWRTNLVKRMSADAEELPNFQQTTWMDEVRQVREQK